MARILEYLTINIAVESLEKSMPQYTALGLGNYAPSPWPDPPIEMTDVTFEVPPGGMFSLIEPWEGRGPVAKFIERRGAGIYSVAVLVDDLAEAMAEWSETAGFEWVLPEPAEVPGGRAARYVSDRTIVNWVKPRSFGGVLFEVFELQGNVRVHDSFTAPDAQGSEKGSADA